MKSRIALRRLLIWLIFLALIAACTPPAAVAPIAPLDPNAIGTYIAQTEQAALTGTASVATLTPTATLRSTFTPEPTYTFVAPITFPATEVAFKVQYFRVKHDHQLEVYNYRSRTAASDWTSTNQTAEVFSMFKDPSLKSATIRTNMNPWGKFMDALNDFETRKLRYLKDDYTALFDHTGFPEMESKTMGGNLITLDEIKGDWGRVHTLDYKNPGDPAEINYFTRPDLVHKFVVIGWSQKNKTSFWNNPPPGDIYWPLVANRPVWIQMEFLEPFPPLPKTVTAMEPQSILKQPAFDAPEASGSIEVGETLNIVEYFPAGSDVWGKISNGGWVVLFMYEKTVPRYMTTWSMATLPPVPPIPTPK